MLAEELGNGTVIGTNGGNIMCIRQKLYKQRSRTREIRMLIMVIMAFMLLTACGYKSHYKGNSFSSKKDKELAQEIESGTLLDEAEQEADTVSDAETDPSKEAYNGSGVPDELSQEVLDEYLETLQPADDEYDYRFAYDYRYHDMLDMVECNDSKCYEKVFGYADVTLEDIETALHENTNISPKYKEFIYEYAVRVRELYPNANLAILYYNLKTLKVEEMSETDMSIETVSTSAAAFYKKDENLIGVAENLDLSKESDDYIILTHELSHAARGIMRWNDEDRRINATFYDFYKMGTYAEEGIITNLAYEIQGLGNKAVFYPMQSTYYRIIMDCIGYTGEDYFNHGVNYLIDEMDKFMGDEQYAYKVVAMIDAQATLRYESYRKVDFHDFQPLYEYIAKMYFKKYVTADMTKEEAEKVFDAFYEEITFNFENMNRKYTIDENTFSPTFETYIAELGIA